jgi:hypothetical protein
MKQIGKHPERVFTYDGKPIERGSTGAWYRAIKRVGLQHFRYHDLRHAWASWHVPGTPLFALQELAGWEPSAWCDVMRISAAAIWRRMRSLCPNIWARFGHSSWWTTTKSRASKQLHEVVLTAVHSDT